MPEHRTHPVLLSVRVYGVNVNIRGFDMLNMSHSW
jgi:hypothetical protein